MRARLGQGIHAVRIHRILARGCLSQVAFKDMARARSTNANLVAPSSFREVLDQVEPRPPDDGAREQKKNYAEHLSNRIAVWIAAALRASGNFPDMLPN